MKREMIKTTVVYLLLGIVGIVIFAGSAFAAVEPACDALNGLEGPAADAVASVKENLCFRPDLVPSVTPLSAVKFDDLMFKVKNIGNRDAGPSFTSVTFLGFSQVPGVTVTQLVPFEVTVTVPTDAIPKGGTADIDITTAVSDALNALALGPIIKNDCPGDNCEIIMVADSFHQIKELEEDNNFADGKCEVGNCDIKIISGIIP